MENMTCVKNVTKLPCRPFLLVSLLLSIIKHYWELFASSVATDFGVHIQLCQPCCPGRLAGSFGAFTRRRLKFQLGIESQKCTWKPPNGGFLK